MHVKVPLLTALFTLTLGACDDGTPTDPPAETAEERGGLGKADTLEGSCAPDEDGPVCGGPAPVGNCWCDEACEQYGDCCLDAFDACGVGEPQPAVSQCLSDAQCEQGQTCSGGVCIELPSPGVDCDDGSDLHPLCDIKPPCGEGEVAAVIGGCFACVDAQSCEPVPVDPVEPPSCDDGSQLSPFCDIKPLCQAGEVAAVIGGCFACVDELTCD